MKKFENSPFYPDPDHAYINFRRKDASHSTQSVTINTLSHQATYRQTEKFKIVLPTSCSYSEKNLKHGPHDVWENMESDINKLTNTLLLKEDDTIILQLTEMEGSNSLFRALHSLTPESFFCKRFEATTIRKKVSLLVKNGMEISLQNFPDSQEEASTCQLYQDILTAIITPGKFILASSIFPFLSLALNVKFIIYEVDSSKNYLSKRTENPSSNSQFPFTSDPLCLIEQIESETDVKVHYTFAIKEPGKLNPLKVARILSVQTKQQQKTQMKSKKSVFSSTERKTEASGDVKKPKNWSSSYQGTTSSIPFPKFFFKMTEVLKDQHSINKSEENYKPRSLFKKLSLRPNSSLGSKYNSWQKGVTNCYVLLSEKDKVYARNFMVNYIPPVKPTIRPITEKSNLPTLIQAEGIESMTSPLKLNPLLETSQSNAFYTYDKSRFDLLSVTENFAVDKSMPDSVGGLVNNQFEDLVEDQQITEVTGISCRYRTITPSFIEEITIKDSYPKTTNPPASKLTLTLYHC